MHHTKPWVEQGHINYLSQIVPYGQYTYNLIKTMMNSNYSIIGCSPDNWENYQVSVFCPFEPTTVQFKALVASGATAAYYPIHIISGYAAF